MPDDQVQFRSPTTGKVQPVPAENWEEALSRGYTPTTHKVMYSPEGQRGMVPNGDLRDYMKQGYQTTPKTEAEKKVTGKGISLKGANQALWDKLKGMVPPSPKGKPFGPTAREFWLGPDDTLLGFKFDPANSGLAQAGREASSEYQRSRKAGSNPMAAAASAGVVGAGSTLGVSEQEQRGMAERGEGGEIIGSSAAPAIMSAVLPELTKSVVGRAAGGPAPRGTSSVSAADVVHAIRHPASALASYVVKQVMKGVPEEAAPAGPSKQGALSKATAPPPVPEQPTSLLSRGRTLVVPGAEPDMNNPTHVKMINDYQTMSGKDLRALAAQGDRFAAFVLRHMPRPQ